MSEYDSICCFRNRHEKGYRILLEITDKCNAHCVFCHWKDRVSLSLGDIERIFHNIGSLPIRDVILTGGEPLLHGELYEILDWFRKRDIECDLCTNGLLVDEKHAKCLAKYLSEISVSLDTVSPEIYDALRGTKNGLQKVLDGIELLQREGIDVHLTCVVNKMNKEEIPQIVEAARERRVHSISFLGMITNIANDKKETEKIALTQTEKEELYALIQKIRSKSEGIKINTKRLVNNQEEVCRAGSNILGITSGGKLLSCIMHRDKAYDILNHELLIEPKNMFCGENIPC